MKYYFKSLYTYLFTLLLPFSTPLGDKIITQRVVYHDGVYSLCFFFGRYSNYMIHKPINLKSQYMTTIMPRDVVQKDKMEQIAVSFDHQSHNGQLIFEDIRVPDTQVEISDFPYYYFPNVTCHPYLNCIGLGYEIINRNFSLLYKLLKNKYINRIAFGFSSIEGEDNIHGAIYYGGIPEELTRGKRTKTCIVPSGQPHWSCDLTSVSFNNTKTSTDFLYNATKDNALFQTNNEYILAPVEFYHFLIDKGLAPLMSTKLCLIPDSEVYDVIICKGAAKGSLPILKFNLNSSFIIESDLNEMLKCNKHDQCDLLLEKNRLNRNEWVFGSSFLRRFDVLFDKDNSAITFYSNKSNIYSTINSHQSNSGVLIILMRISYVFTLLGAILNLMTILFKR